jgi:hypothetical protein
MPDSLSAMCRSMVDGLENPDQVGTPATLDELLRAFAIGTPLCVVLVDAHWAAIEKELDVRRDIADKVTATELQENVMTMMGLPPEGQALINHALIFHHDAQDTERHTQPAASEQSNVEDAAHEEAAVRSSMTCHMVVCAAAATSKAMRGASYNYARPSEC